MPLIHNIEDPRFVKQLNGLAARMQFIRELASAILPQRDGFESVFSIANRVYERHSSPQNPLLTRPGVEPPERTALSA